MTEAAPTQARRPRKQTRGRPPSGDGPARKGAVRERLVTALELVGIALQPGPLRQTATATATELATRLGCERVAIGLRQESIGFGRLAAGLPEAGPMRVEALSHSAHFDARTQLIRDLGLAMDEAADQDATVVHPVPEGGPARITRAHEELAQQQGSGAVATVPLACDGRVIGALTLERAPGQQLDAPTLQLVENVASLLGPILELARAAEAGPLARTRSLVREWLVKLMAPGEPGLKLLAGLAAAFLLVLAFAPGTHRVTADATLEGRVQRAIVAGVEGYVAETSARAGDVVSRGQELARLDDRDLLLEQRKLEGRRAQLRREYREAVAAHDRAEASILSARSAQASAQLELVEQNLARTRFLAPFDGVVVEGDLSQSLGSPVAKGDVLFEVAPLEGYRIILEVDEREIADMAPGQRGRLVLSALPRERLPLVLERVTPVAAAEDGRNFFRVEARLERPVESLRPGMEGVAKIEVGPRRLAWIWTHGLLDAVRLWAWSWWP